MRYDWYGIPSQSDTIGDPAKDLSMYIVRPSITDINDLCPVQDVSDESTGSHISTAGLVVLMYLTQSKQQSHGRQILARLPLWNASIVPRISEFVT